MEIPKIICFQCNSQMGTITMNCSRHPIRKRCCESCFKELKNKTKCIEVDCDVQINIRKITRTFQPWKMQSWEFYKEKFIPIFLIPLIGICFLLAIGFFYAIPAMVSGLSVFEYISGDDKKNEPFLAIFLFFYNLCSSMGNSFIVFTLILTLFKYDQFRPPTIEFIKLCKEKKIYYLSVAHIIISHFNLYFFITKSPLLWPCIVYNNIYYMSMEIFFIYHYWILIQGFFYKVFTTTFQAIMDYFMEEKIEEYFLEKDTV